MNIEKLFEALDTEEKDEFSDMWIEWVTGFALHYGFLEIEKKILMDEANGIYCIERFLKSNLSENIPEKLRLKLRQAKEDIIMMHDITDPWNSKYTDGITDDEIEFIESLGIKMYE